jgi:CheY-like chemotaxis protein
MSDMRILIIEDDHDAAAYLAKAFREAGHVADQANDGVTGYDLALEGGYDVAIVDRSARSMTASRACAPAATTICRSLTPSPSCSLGSRPWRVAAQKARPRRRSCGSPT